MEELTRRTLPNKFPIPMCRQIIKQVLLGLDFLHRQCGIVHTDLKLDNFLLRPSDTRGIPTLGGSDSPKIDLSQVSLGQSAVVISDLGVAIQRVIQPYALHAPKVYLRIPYGPSADIWNMGCLAFQLVTYCWLFNPKAGAQWSQDDDILGRWCRSMASNHFQSMSWPVENSVINILTSLVTFEDTTSERILSKDEPELLADMLSCMLRLRPDDRESASELLSHPWLRDA
ncbi:kinase-like protein [Armillaria gallica]|uniref:non-specific serine/threonine protein kinase n=1 Tax=Armillaria gallica TaxID=47427 RepID=A0A2H3D124_ARMGA|nr:kinase-like protein [Armillaria gallica]